MRAGMNAAIGDQPLDRLARDFAAERIEAREDDRARRVVDDQLDAGRGFERADVAPLAADDASLEIVARQIDDRDGRLDRVLGGAALDGVGNDLLRARRGGLARLGFEPLDQVGGVAPGVSFDLLQQQLARFVGAQPGDALQLALPIGDELFGARGGRGGALLVGGERLFARAEILFDPVGCGEAIGERARLVGEPLLEADDLLAALARLLLGFGGQLVRLFARFERRFLAKRFGVALGLLERAIGTRFWRFWTASSARPALRVAAPQRSAPLAITLTSSVATAARPDGGIAEVPITGPVRPGGQLVNVQRWRREGKAPLCRVGRSDEPA